MTMAVPTVPTDAPGWDSTINGTVSPWQGFGGIRAQEACHPTPESEMTLLRAHK